MYQNRTYIINQKLPKTIYFIIFISLLTLIFVLIFITIPIKRIISFDGFVVLEDNRYYIKIYVGDEDLKKINCHNVIVDEKKTKLDYFIIKEAYKVDNSLEIYHEVFLKVDIEKKKRVENYKLEVMFIQPKTTYLKEIINYVKRGLYEGIN